MAERPPQAVHGGPSEAVAAGWKRLRPGLRRPWLMLAALALVLLWSADHLFPLSLPEDDLARVVLAEDGTPLWRFADQNGVWRYPVGPAEVSPYYLEVLLTYEDRWFYRHPGGNPLALGRAVRPRAWSSVWVTSGLARPPPC